MAVGVITGGAVHRRDFGEEERKVGLGRGKKRERRWAGGGPRERKGCGRERVRKWAVRPFSALWVFFQKKN